MPIRCRGVGVAFTVACLVVCDTPLPSLKATQALMRPDRQAWPLKLAISFLSFLSLSLHKQRDEQVHKAEQQRTEVRAALKATKARVQQLKQTADELVLERESLAAEVEALGAQRSKFAETLAVLEADRVKLEAALASRRRDFDKADEQ